MTLVKVRELEKHYRQFSLKKVSFEVESGTILGIIGPNGSGKTTTLQLLMDLIPSDGGEVSLFGKNYPKDTLEIRRQTGYVAEEQRFYENRSVGWTEGFVSSFYPNWDNGTFERLLKTFAISRTMKVKELSKGMKVKLSLALSLAYDPKLIILDEPTSGLDPVIRRELLEILSHITADEEHSVVFSSHITDDIARIADYILFLIDGEVKTLSEKDLLMANWKRIHSLSELPDILSNRIFSKRTTPFGSNAVTNEYLTIAPFLDPLIKKEQVKVESLSLDDILLELVRGGASCSRC